jgi:GT2 family glycosyltransferase
MKIYQWIDKYNEKLCYKITKKYTIGVSEGQPTFYYLHISFWPFYLIRSLLVLISLIILKKSSYEALLTLLSNKESRFYPPKKYSLPYIKLADLLAAWLGFNYLSSRELLPLLDDHKIRNTRIVMTKPNDPLVSIVITVNQPLCYIYNTLLSIQNMGTLSFNFEIIVIDEGSTSNVQAFFEDNTEGTTYFRSENATNFSSWTIGAQHAKGKLICFLTDTVLVTKGWLKSLVQTLDDSKVGAAGSKIINRNGLLLHAGGILYSDCSHHDYGKDSHPEHPNYNYVRETDYCSGSAIMFRKDEFLQLQKKNQAPLSQFLKDIDSSMGIRFLLGKKVVYQPLSRVIHNGPVQQRSSKDDASFKHKWGTYLLSNPISNDIEMDSRRYQSGKTILFIDDVIPASDQDSGSNRLLKIMRIVRSLGYHVIYVPNDGNKRGQYFHEMVQEGFEVLYRFPNRKGMIVVLLNILRFVDAAWLCKPHNNELFSFIFNTRKDCIWIYDTIDLHYLRLQREATLSGNEKLLSLAMSTKQIEISIAKKAKITIAITEDEKILLDQEGIKNVFIIPNIHDTNSAAHLRPAYENRNGLLFIGGYLHKPNIDAAEWLVKKIMPRVWKVDPTIKLTLLGSNPTAQILSYQSENILVPGYIMDVSSYFENNRVFVAPLRFGAGMKGKIGQSLEYNLPIVSTAIGVEGMDLIDNNTVVLANTEMEFAEKILHLYKNKDLWELIAKNSVVALQKFSPEKVKIKIQEMFADNNLN